jgi:hypothetical protein
MQWERSAEWVDAKEQEWNVEGASAGSVTEVGPLSFVTVYDAGHMVPMDQGKHALDMISRFTRGESLAGETLGRGREGQGQGEERNHHHIGGVPGSMQRVRAGQTTVGEAALKLVGGRKEAAGGDAVAASWPPDM